MDEDMFIKIMTRFHEVSVVLAGKIFPEVPSYRLEDFTVFPS